MTTLTNREQDRAVQLLTKMTHRELVAWLERMCMDACREVTENIAVRNGNRLAIVGAHDHIAIYDPDQQTMLALLKGRGSIVLWDGSLAMEVDDGYDGSRTTWPPISKATTVARLRALADIIENGEPQ